MHVEVPRPMRADARRNYERIVATARDAFAEHGVDVPLDGIAKTAKVGAGTLYRHFPNRATLIEAVYRGEVTRQAERAFELLAELPADEALLAWVRAQVGFVTEFHGLVMALKEAIDHDSPTFAHCKAELYRAAGALLEPAQAAGAIRPDLQPHDLMRLAHGVGMAAANADAEGAERLLSVVLAGLRPATGTMEA
jgi:AcrR family transcriptional regulator